MRAAVAVGVALVLWRLGHRLVAGTLLAVIVVVTAASLLFPSVATRIDQATAALQRVVGRGLALVLFGAVQLLVFALEGGVRPGFSFSSAVEALDVSR